MYTAISLDPNLKVQGNKQSFNVENTETKGALAIVTTRNPTDENPTTTSIASKTILEDGFFLEYKSFLDSTKNLTTFGLTKKGIEDPIFVVKDDKTIEFKYTATGTISGSGGGGSSGTGITQTYFDNEMKKYALTTALSSYVTTSNLTTALQPYITTADATALATNALDSAKTYTNSRLTSYPSNTQLEEILADYAKTADMNTADESTLNSAKTYTDDQLANFTPTGSTNTLSKTLTVEKDTTTSTTSITWQGQVVSNTLSNNSTQFKYTTPYNNYLSFQVIGISDGIQTNIGTGTTAWAQISDRQNSQSIMIGIPLTYALIGNLASYSFQSNDLVSKAYVDSAIANNSAYLIPIGASMLIPYDPFSSFTGTQKWNAIKDFIGWGEWRLPGDTISSVTYPLAYQRIGSTVPQMAVSTPGGVVNLNIINGKQMYVFRVL